MRIAIIGAGAVGGYYGARLAQAGHDVTLMARGANLQAIRGHGLHIRSGTGDFDATVRAEEDATRVGPVELVIFAVKTYSNARALTLVPPLVGPGTAVLTLQNGVESADAVAEAAGPGAVLAGTTYIASTLVSPGVIEHIGTVQRIILGEAFGERVITDRVARITAELGAAGIRAEAAADSRIAIWEKFIFLAPVAGLTAAARLPIGPAWAHDAFKDVCRRAMTEVEALARHEGVAVAGDVVARKMEYVDKTPPAVRSSMMVDLVSARPLELEALAGAVVRRGRSAGIPTPIMETVYAILKPFEQGPAEPTP